MRRNRRTIVLGPLSALALGILLAGITGGFRMPLGITSDSQTKIGVPLLQQADQIARVTKAVFVGRERCLALGRITAERHVDIPLDNHGVLSRKFRGRKHMATQRRN